MLLLAGLGACSATPSATGPYQPISEIARNTALAIELTREAADDLDAGNLESAEALLRDALTADLYHGPAHNNLGVVFLEQGMLYEAAQEFEWAKKLLPSAPDPRVNLALVLESAGQEENALLAWESALKVAPGCLQAAAGLERLMAVRGHSESQSD